MSHDKIFGAELTIAELRNLLLESAETISRASVLLVQQHRALNDLGTVPTVKGCAADALNIARTHHAHADKLVQYLKETTPQ